MGYIIKKPAVVVPQIVTSLVQLSALNLKTPGYTFDIPEYPAVSGYFWNVLYANAEIVKGTTNYGGLSAINITTATATEVQFKTINNLMQLPANTWLTIDRYIIGTGNQFAVNQKLQVNNPGVLTLGDRSLNIYIGAILIQK